MSFFKSAKKYGPVVGATIGKCGLVPEKFNNMNLTENAARLTPLLIDKQFFTIVKSRNKEKYANLKAN